MALTLALTLVFAHGVPSDVDDGWSITSFTSHGGGGRTEAPAPQWLALGDTNCEHAAASSHILRDPPRLLIAGGTAQLLGVN